MGRNPARTHPCTRRTMSCLSSLMLTSDTCGSSSGYTHRTAGVCGRHPGVQQGRQLFLVHSSGPAARQPLRRVGPYPPPRPLLLLPPPPPPPHGAFRWPPALLCSSSRADVRALRHCQGECVARTTAAGRAACGSWARASARRTRPCKLVGQGARDQVHQGPAVQLLH